MSKGAYIGAPKPEYESVFANNSWRQIIKACQKNEVPSTWAVGDQKAMDIGGTEYLIDIIGKDHDDYADGSGKAPLTFQLHDVYGTTYGLYNSRATNGNWNGSVMRTTRLPAILALMPTEVQSAVKEVSKFTAANSASVAVSTTDKLFLLSEIEVFGTSNYSQDGEGSVYEYYASGGSAIKKFANGNAYDWWLRSPSVGSGYNFCAVSSGGGLTSYSNESYSGVAFAFCFGGTSEVDSVFGGYSAAREVKNSYIGVPTLSASLGELEVGSIVKLKIDGVKTDFIVAHQGNPDSTMYDASCDGTWLLMKDIYKTQKWDSNYKYYAESDTHAYLNGEFLALFDESIQTAIKQVKIPYGTGSGTQVLSGSNGLSTKIFPLSNYEVGFDTQESNNIVVDGKPLSYFSGKGDTNANRIAYMSDGTAKDWWLRSPHLSYSDQEYHVATGGSLAYGYVSYTLGIRPAMVLPTNLSVDGNGNVTAEEPGWKDVARKIKKAYIGVNGVARLWWASGNPISLRNVGDSVYMNVNGERKEFIIVQKGNPDSSIYDASCDGVWLLMKDLYVQMAYASSTCNYTSSSVRSYLNGTFLESLDAGIQSTIKQVKIPYINWNNSGSPSATTGSSGLSQKVFLLSAVEVGVSGSYVPSSDGVRLPYFATSGTNIAYPSGSTEAGSWWTRTPYCRGTTYVGCVLFTGAQTNSNCTSTAYYVRPAMILPHEALIDDDGNVVS